jgi:6-phosphogluconolactonase
MLNRSRRILWLVTGSDKVGALARLREGDTSIPGGKIQRDQAVVLADEAAANRGPKDINSKSEIRNKSK